MFFVTYLFILKLISWFTPFLRLCEIFQPQSSHFVSQLLHCHLYTQVFNLISHSGYLYFLIISGIQFIPLHLLQQVFSGHWFCFSVRPFLTYDQKKILNFIITAGFIFIVASNSPRGRIFFTCCPQNKRCNKLCFVSVCGLCLLIESVDLLVAEWLFRNHETHLLTVMGFFQTS